MKERGGGGGEGNLGYPIHFGNQNELTDVLNQLLLASIFMLVLCKYPIMVTY